MDACITRVVGSQPCPGVGKTAHGGGCGSRSLRLASSADQADGSDTHSKQGNLWRHDCKIDDLCGVNTSLGDG